MGTDTMSSGQHLPLLAVIVCEVELISIVIYRVILVQRASVTGMFDSPSLMVFKSTM